MAKRKKRKKIKRSRKKTRKVKKSRKKTRIVKRSRKKPKRFKRKKISKKRQILKAPNQSKDSDGNTIIKVSDSWANQAYVNQAKYKNKYKLSIKENEKFWAKEGKRI